MHTLPIRYLNTESDFLALNKGAWKLRLNLLVFYKGSMCRAAICEGDDLTVRISGYRASSIMDAYRCIAN